MNKKYFREYRVDVLVDCSVAQMGEPWKPYETVSFRKEAEATSHFDAARYVGIYSRGRGTYKPEWRLWHNYPFFHWVGVVEVEQYTTIVVRFDDMTAQHHNVTFHERAQLLSRTFNSHLCPPACADLPVVRVHEKTFQVKDFKLTVKQQSADGLKESISAAVANNSANKQLVVGDVNAINCACFCEEEISRGGSAVLMFQTVVAIYQVWDLWKFQFHRGISELYHLLEEIKLT
ncbi:hypothetical protein FOCC_FOCC005097 [Frankliniella occidentalis]|nr:hypothetical protein FOCC_FOCC005097 [Frankliniella occidentalis]